MITNIWLYLIFNTLTPKITQKVEHHNTLPPSKPNASQEESQNSFRIFFILCVLLIAILLVYLLIKFKFHYLPESIAIVVLGKFTAHFLASSVH